MMLIVDICDFIEVDKYSDPEGRFQRALSVLFGVLQRRVETTCNILCTYNNVFIRGP